MELDVAAYGWLGEEWAVSYPDDLPLEWRLDYYANEFRSVVVPAGHWREQQDETLLEWLQDAHEGFSFYWELETEADAERLLRLYRQQPQLLRPGGWLWMSAAAMAESLEAELAQWAPLARCSQPGLCEGGLRLFSVAEGEDLRQLRQRLDESRAGGVESLLLVVMPSPAAGVSLDQLQTLCQLYGG